LSRWATDKTNSRIVRVNSIQGLFDLAKYRGDQEQAFDLILKELAKENIPSINARIKRMGY